MLRITRSARGASVLLGLALLASGLPAAGAQAAAPADLLLELGQHKSGSRDLKLAISNNGGSASAAGTLQIETLAPGSDAGSGAAPVQVPASEPGAGSGAATVQVPAVQPGQNH